MAELDEVTLVAGVPQESGEVPTLAVVRDAILATNTALSTIDGRVDGLETLITSTNTKLDTAITALQIIDNMVLAAGSSLIGKVDVQFAGTAPDVGSGTGGSKTQRMLIDSSQLDPTVAHDAADSGAPYKQGFKATSSLAGLTLVASADRTDGFAGLDGVQIVRPHCNLEDLISGVAAITDGSSTSVIASAGAGVKNYVTTAIIANTSATAVTVDLRDGAAGTVKATLPVPANTSGVVCNLPVPLGFSAATAVCADPSAAATTVTVTLIGFKSKV